MSQRIKKKKVRRTLVLVPIPIYWYHKGKEPRSHRGHNQGRTTTIMPASKSTDEFISVEEVTVSPRGRKKVIDSTLTDLFTRLPEGKAVRLTSKFGAVPKAQRAAVSQVIRKHWEHVRNDACRIDYTPEGVPQVRQKANV